MEAALTTLLAAVCPRVYPDVAPPGAAAPYITYQHIGGTPLRYVEGSASNLRHSMVQINSWAATRAEALAIARGVEDALSTAGTLTARPDSEPIGDVDDTTDRRSCLQDFSIWSAR
ncbi:MAG: DUF3168 domain-containing protein [Roseateles sp.]|uniref:DUF3168 domain-containing protein n=1 Tax=Roseateles sp. TaxID=1971397 RepID=UPI0040360B3C